eukprot:scaffold1397_cov254-Pinguiococcus_pyrenoidosus.AAC.35
MLGTRLLRGLQGDQDEDDDDEEGASYSDEGTRTYVVLSVLTVAFVPLAVTIFYIWKTRCCSTVCEPVRLEGDTLTDSESECDSDEEDDKFGLRCEMPKHGRNQCECEGEGVWARSARSEFVLRRFLSGVAKNRPWTKLRDLPTPPPPPPLGFEVKPCDLPLKSVKLRPNRPGRGCQTEDCLLCWVTLSPCGCPVLVVHSE